MKKKIPIGFSSRIVFVLICFIISVCLYNRISSNLKSTVYCTAIREGGQLEWDFAWSRYLHTNVGSEKNLLLSALGCSRETWILAR